MKPRRRISFFYSTATILCSMTTARRMTYALISQASSASRHAIDIAKSLKRCAVSWVTSTIERVAALSARCAQRHPTAVYEGVNDVQLAANLQRDGIQAFAKSWKDMLDCLVLAQTKQA